MEDYREILKNRWQVEAARFFERPWEDRSRKEKVTHGFLALTYLTTREVLRDRSVIVAAGLAFFTILAIVPLLTVATSLMAAFGVLDGQVQGFFDTIQQLFPDVAAGAASYIEELAIGSAQSVGGIGAVTLLIIGLVLFNAIEETMTRIWRGTHNRSIVMKMLTFYAVITFGPVLIALSIVQTAGAQIYLTEMGIDSTFLERMLPGLYALLAFTLLIKLVPNAVVRWPAALVGGLFTAIVFELAKWGFNLYVNQLLLQTYDVVYGTLALIPIGLIWLYIVWLVILVGAELAYSFQHIRTLMLAEAGRRSSPSRRGAGTWVHPLLALEVLAQVIEAFESNEGPITEEKLIQATALDLEITRGIIESWEEAGVLIGIEGDDDEEGRAYTPARPSKSVALDELIEWLWVEEKGRYSETIGELSQKYLQVSRDFFRNQSALDLIDAAPDAEEAEVEADGSVISPVEAETA